MESNDLDLFFMLCAKLSTRRELHDFFDLLLTEDEKQQISSRIVILQDLLEGDLSQREIAKTQNVSISQITRGSNALKKASPKVKKFLEENLTSWRR